MTGWRLGWIVAPPSLTTSLGVLLEYNTSCAPGFVQAAGTAALRGGEEEIEAFAKRLRRAKDQVVSGLRSLQGVEVGDPSGGMYAFFRITDAPALSSLELAKDLVRQAGLGLAPGGAFGPEGEGWLRWCFAAQASKNASGLDRLERYLSTARE
jgi:aspartate/methionine/tyrosine aminotransferase